ncbi:hypothetical protein TSOC_004605, partial [Tetrabaena socialis]
MSRARAPTSWCSAWSGRAWTRCLPTRAAPPWRSTRRSRARTASPTCCAATSRWAGRRFG